MSYRALLDLNEMESKTNDSTELAQITFKRIKVLLDLGEVEFAKSLLKSMDRNVSTLSEVEKVLLLKYSRDVGLQLHKNTQLNIMSSCDSSRDYVVSSAYQEVLTNSSRNLVENKARYLNVENTQSNIRGTGGVNDIKLSVIGGGSTIGGSCYILNIKNKCKIMIDCGSSFDSDNNPKYLDLSGVDLKSINCVVLTHSHIDHVGSIHLLEDNINPSCKLLATKETRTIVENTVVTASKFVQRFECVGTNSMYDIFDDDKLSVTLYFNDAGHIPGSVMVQVCVIDKVFNAEWYGIFSGDIGEGNRLQEGYKLELFAKPDLFVVEGTNCVDSPRLSRDGTIEMLKIKISKSIKEGKSVLIPAFSICRAQEMLNILNEITDSNFDIYVDGNMKQTTPLIKNLGYKVNTNKVVEVDSNDRGLVIGRMLQGEPLVVVASSGMLLQGSASYEYLTNVLSSDRVVVCITGYQNPKIENTLLSDNLTAVCINDLLVDKNIKVFNAKISGHLSYSNLNDLIKRVGSEKTVVVHTDLGDNFDGCIWGINGSEIIV